MKYIEWCMVSMIVALGGCSGAGTIHKENHRNMLDLYDSKTRRYTREDGAEKRVRPTLPESGCNETNAQDVDLEAYTRNVENELKVTFQHLPNPMIFLYMDPHLAEEAGVPIPGYTTAFNLYTHDQWALPYELPSLSEELPCRM